MELVIDTSAIVAVLVGEPERDEIVRATSACTLIAPGSVPWEVGNAFSAMLKQKRIALVEAQKGLAIFQRIPLRYVEIDFENALAIGEEHNMYAYDAYFLDCALRRAVPLLTLDGALRRAARAVGVGLVEV